MSKREKELLKQMKEIREEIVWKGMNARMDGMPFQESQIYRDWLHGESNYNELRREYEELYRKNMKRDLIVVIVALSVAVIAALLLKFS